MIRVHKDFEAPPPGLATDACNAQRLKALTEKAAHNFSGYHYRDKTLVALLGIYKNKCGYCETPKSAGAALRVDHYRPKGAVQESLTHEGYYWLGYEWSNLILSCETCNGKKLDQFPLQQETARVLHPLLGTDGLPLPNYYRADGSLLRAECPLLLNPELDNPDDHVAFLPNGTMRAKTVNGSTSIKIYFLERDELIINRKKMTDGVVNDLKVILDDYLRGEIGEETYRYSTQNVYKKVSLNRQAGNAYSRVATALFDDFETFVVARFPSHQQPYIRQTFDLYQKGKLWPVLKLIDP